MRYRNYNRNADRFNNYREMIARYTGKCSCGATIKPGQVMGYHAGLKKGKCAHCWQSWSAENREADMYEAQHGYCGGEYDY